MKYGRHDEPMNPRMTSAGMEAITHFTMNTTMDQNFILTSTTTTWVGPLESTITLLFIPCLEDPVPAGTKGLQGKKRPMPAHFHNRIPGQKPWGPGSSPLKQCSQKYVIRSSGILHPTPHDSQ